MNGTLQSDLAGHCMRLEAEIVRLKQRQQQQHSELLAIHNIGMCIAECPPIHPDDTYTVRMVKEMAERLNNMHKEV